MSAADKAKRTVVMIEIPRDELALRIAEQCLGMKAPAGTDPGEALDAMDRVNPVPVPMGTSFRHAADAAVLFFHQCVDAGRQPS